IRDFHVTGVQTCALPISSWKATRSASRSSRACSSPATRDEHALEDLDALLVAFHDAAVHVDRVADVHAREVGLELVGDDAFEEEIGRASCRGRGGGGGRT